MATARTIIYSGSDECLKDIPEYFEGELEEILKARDASLSKAVPFECAYLFGCTGGLRDLGPSDLVHVVKSKQKGKNDTKMV